MNKERHAETAKADFCVSHFLLRIIPVRVFHCMLSFV
jgi:hypothetical protein